MPLAPKVCHPGCEETRMAGRVRWEWMRASAAVRVVVTDQTDAAWRSARQWRIHAFGWPRPALIWPRVTLVLGLASQFPSAG